MNINVTQRLLSSARVTTYGALLGFALLWGGLMSTASAQEVALTPNSYAGFCDTRTGRGASGHK